jgi:hydroxymethylpyrimidine/phosphomethylpyrimidine kinase
VSTHIVCVLAIGGLDPSGGGGLPADARAIAAFGAHPCLVTTAVIAQNTQGVQKTEAVSGEMLRLQLQTLSDDIEISAIKIGVLPGIESVEAVCDFLKNCGKIPVVFDPVLAPSSGPEFSNQHVTEKIKLQLLQFCDLVTPNLAEAQQLSGIAINSAEDARCAAKILCEKLGARSSLIKGGHGAGDESVDVLFSNEQFYEFRAPRIQGYEVRGTGCLLASAVAAQLAQDIELEIAVRNAKAWLTEKIKTAKIVGKGRRVAL